MLHNLVVRLLPGILPGVQATGRYRVSEILSLTLNLTLRTLDNLKLNFSIFKNQRRTAAI